MTECFPFCRVRNMNLDHGTGNRRNSIRDSNRSMRVGTSIQNNPVIGESHFMNFIDKLPLHIRLVIIDLDHRVEISQPRQVLLERGFPVNIFSLIPKRLRLGPFKINIFIFTVFTEYKINKKNDETGHFKPDLGIKFRLQGLIIKIMSVKLDKTVTTQRKNLYLYLAKIYQNTLEIGLKW